MRSITAAMLALVLPICAIAQYAPGVVEEGRAQEGAQAILARAFWPGQDLSSAFYRIFADEEMRDLVEVARSGGPDGTAFLVLRPGTYWIMAVVDVNANDRPDAGDGIGFYGVNELSETARPAPLEVVEGKVDSIIIPILVKLNEELRMVPLPWAQATQRGTVSGKVAGLEGRAGVAALLPLVDDARPFVAPLEDDGGFVLAAPPGAYRLVIAVDGDGDGRLSQADPVGTVGSIEEPISVTADTEIETGVITVAPGAVPEGLPTLIAGRLRGPELPDGARAIVAFFRDAEMSEQLFGVETGLDGRFAAAVEPGAYYLRATVDIAGDDVLGVGDMLGFFGVTDLMSEQIPAPLQVTEDALMMDVIIPITARINEEGRLSPWRDEAAAVDE